jgi:hypothetical protein
MKSLRTRIVAIVAALAAALIAGGAGFVGH